MKIDKNNKCYVCLIGEKSVRSMSYYDAMEKKTTGKLEYLTQEEWDCWQNKHGDKVSPHRINFYGEDK